MKGYEKPRMEVIELENNVMTFPCLAQNCSSDCIGQITGDPCANEWPGSNPSSSGTV